MRVVENYKVGAKTDINKLAGAITKFFEKRESEEHTLSLRCVGAASVNQAAKSVIVANSNLAKEGGRVLKLVPSFIPVEAGGDFVGMQFVLHLDNI